MAARAAAASSTNRRVSISTSLAKDAYYVAGRHYPPGRLANEETEPPRSRGVQPFSRRIVCGGDTGRPPGVPLRHAAEDVSPVLGRTRAYRLGGRAISVPTSAIRPSASVPRQLR